RPTPTSFSARFIIPPPPEPGFGITDSVWKGRRRSVTRFVKGIFLSRRRSAGATDAAPPAPGAGLGRARRARSRAPRVGSAGVRSRAAATDSRSRASSSRCSANLAPTPARPLARRAILARVPAPRGGAHVSTVADGKVVSIDYVLTGTDGKELDRSKEGSPLVYLHGSHGIVEGLEEALTGKSVGERVQVTVPPNKGYG